MTSLESSLLLYSFSVARQEYGGGDVAALRQVQDPIAPLSCLPLTVMQ